MFATSVGTVEIWDLAQAKRVSRFVINNELDQVDRLSPSRSVKESVLGVQTLQWDPEKIVGGTSCPVSDPFVSARQEYALLGHEKP